MDGTNEEVGITKRRKKAENKATADNKKTQILDRKYLRETTIDINQNEELCGFETGGGGDICSLKCVLRKKSKEELKET